MSKRRSISNPHFSSKIITVVAETVLQQKEQSEKLTTPVEQLHDVMAPTITENRSEEHDVEIRVKQRETTGDKYDTPLIHFELSSEPDPVTAAHTPAPTENTKPKQIVSTKDKEASTAPTSGGYLAKPSRIYVEDKPSQSNNDEESTPLQIPFLADEPVTGMQLVVKDSLEATEEPELTVQQAQPILMSPVEEPPSGDETGETRRRAMERIAKLRNLSFNINAADPNNEFESVPAYLRRNMELHNSIADVESFYSNYTVKSDENNKAEIGTINTFLEGKKPD